MQKRMQFGKDLHRFLPKPITIDEIMQDDEKWLKITDIEKIGSSLIQAGRNKKDRVSKSFQTPLPLISQSQLLQKKLTSTSTKLEQASTYSRSNTKR
jgi:hypothetical protein